MQHQHCDIDWCKYLQSKRDGTAPKTSKRNKLPFRYLDEMLPLYERLSDVSLLARCVPGLTQNQNEAFNHTIWQRCPKEKYGSSQAVQRAVTSAVLKWNIGGIGRANMMSALGMQAGYHTKKAIAIMDTRRLKASALASSEQEKKKRKRKKEEQIKEDRHQKAQKGDGVLADKSNKAVSSAPKAEAWDNIYFQFSARFGQKYSLVQVKTAWKTLRQKAKKIVKTGGGPAPDKLSSLTQAIKEFLPKDFKEICNPYDDDCALTTLNKDAVTELQFMAGVPQAQE